MSTPRLKTTLSSHEQGIVLKPSEPKAKQCPVCGDTFVSERQNKKYCSYECNQQAQNPPGPLRLRFGVLARDKFKCRYCGRGVKDGARLNVDHVVPNRRDKSKSFLNLVTSCSKCNIGKGGLTISEHRRHIARLKCLELPALSYILE